MQNCYFFGQADAAEFLSIAKELNSTLTEKVEEFDEKLISQFAYTCTGDLCPMAAVIGGITAQEVMKVSCQAGLIQCNKVL